MELVRRLEVQRLQLEPWAEAYSFQLPSVYSLREYLQACVAGDD